jgi:hypothetical protein
MIFMIISTFSIYQSRKNDFLKNSQEHIFVIENISDEEIESIRDKLINLTFQNVNIEKKDKKIVVTIMCPPEKIGWIKKKIFIKGE